MITTDNYLIECVPNISEGRDLNKVEKIVNGLSDHNVNVIHSDSGYDANRTVITIVGEVSHMLKAIEYLYKSCAGSIDMKTQKGEHPRLGAVDVCPFIPFDWKWKDDLIEKVRLLAQSISEQLKAPIFLYKESSIGESQKSLPEIRKGEYEQLIRRPEAMKFIADFGSEFRNHSFGGSVLGVRDFMVAYNIDLDTADLILAKSIAKEMRKVRSTKGSFKNKDIKPLQILGWYMEEYECCQISTNIHNPRELSLADVYEFTKEISARFEVQVTGSELVGMIPSFAYELCKNDKITNLEVIEKLGLNTRGDFKLKEKLIEIPTT